jgi:hypothetical protein
MGKSLGIAAFVILLLSLPIPIAGNYISLLAVLILCGAAYCRETTWTVIVDLVAWVKMFLLSPSWHVMMFASGYMKSSTKWAEGLGTMDRATKQAMDANNAGMAGMNGTVLFITVAILAAPIVILVWRRATAPAGESVSS